MPKHLGAFVVPAMAVVLIALLILVEHRAQGATSGSMGRVYPSVVTAVAGFLLFMTAVVISAGMGAQVVRRTRRRSR